MRNESKMLGALGAFAVLCMAVSQAAPLGTAFTYQGRLTSGTNAANGIYDFQFSAWDAASGGQAVAGPITNSPVGVTNGLFTVTLDLGGGVFTGNARWLEIAVRTNGGGTFTLLVPRQPLTPVPYALYAPGAGTAATAVSLTGTLPASQLTGTIAQAQFPSNGTFLGSVTAGGDVLGRRLNIGQGHTLTGTLSSIAGGSNNINRAGFSTLGGGFGNTLEAGLDAATLGGGQGNTIEVRALAATIGGGVANRIESNAVHAVISGGATNRIGTNAFTATIGGGRANTIGTNAESATIGGGLANTLQAGAAWASIAGGAYHRVEELATAATIGGGIQNTIGSNAFTAAIAGGQGNAIQAGAESGVIGGGRGNTIQTSAWEATVAGGAGNTIGDGASAAAIGGGASHLVQAEGATIAGGVGNRVLAGSAYGAIGGGSGNSIQTNAPGATIGGGLGNSAEPGAWYAAIPGGSGNTVGGVWSLAAGRNAKALHDGAFVWGDATGGDVSSSGANQFVVRATGGLWLTGNTTLNWGASVLHRDQGGSIELGDSLSAGLRPFLDFHYGVGAAQDFNVRLMNSANDELSVYRSGALEMLRLNAAGLWINGTRMTNGGGPLAANSVFATNIATGTVVRSLNSLTEAVTLAAGANITLGTVGNTITISAPGGAGGGWSLTGNAGTSPAVNFLGTTDNQPLEVRVNGARALRLEPGDGVPNVILGGSNNAVAVGLGGCVVGGGWGNAIRAGAANSLIAGGVANTIQTNAWNSNIGGGVENTLQESARYCTIAGGWQNSALLGAGYSAIGGGVGNALGSYASYAAIGGGISNLVQSWATGSTIGGGQANAIAPLSLHATIPGGVANAAVSYGFAAGRRAKANHQGAWVWADSTDADIASSANNQFTARASGGVRFFSNSGATVGVQLAAGGNAWSAISDRNLKENVRPVDPRQILEQVLALPVTEWNLVSQDPAIRHLGPMAQDFHAAFGLGESDRHISASDADGVALAAIQGLNQKLTDELKRRDAENAELKRRLEQLERLVQQLAK